MRCALAGAGSARARASPRAPPLRQPALRPFPPTAPIPPRRRCCHRNHRCRHGRRRCPPCRRQALLSLELRLAASGGHAALPTWPLLAALLYGTPRAFAARSVAHAQRRLAATMLAMAWRAAHSAARVRARHLARLEMLARRIQWNWREKRRADQAIASVRAARARAAVAAVAACCPMRCVLLQQPPPYFWPLLRLSFCVCVSNVGSSLLPLPVPARASTHTPRPSPLPPSLPPSYLQVLARTGETLPEYHARVRAAREAAAAAVRRADVLRRRRAAVLLAAQRVPDYQLAILTVQAFSRSWLANRAARAARLRRAAFAASLAEHTESLVPAAVRWQRQFRRHRTASELLWSEYYRASGGGQLFVGAAAAALDPELARASLQPAIDQACAAQQGALPAARPARPRPAKLHAALFQIHLIALPFGRAVHEATQRMR